MNEAMHSETVASRTAPFAVPFRVVDDASDLLKRLFRDYDGHLAVRLWDGTALRLGNGGPGDPDPRFTLIFRNPDVVCSMVRSSDPLRLAEAYFRGDIDIEGDFFAALELRNHLATTRMSLSERLNALFTAFRLRAIKNPQLKKRGAARPPGAAAGASQFHYNAPNKFYALWLDPSMVYSCAYFEQASHDLVQAQQAKLDHICRKLQMKPGDRFLDIGCGWGALVIHAAKHYGVHAHGVTQSPQQLELARQRIAEAGLDDRVTVELCDYRRLAGDAIYDKVASVGMFEHIGLRNMADYVATVNRLLKPSGLFLNHGITHDAAGWNKTPFTELINRYVFPDGQLDTVSNIQCCMERARFEIADVEALRPHYALTLRHWVRQLESSHAQALEYVDESTYRIWRMYMAACAVEFEAGEIGIYQVLASKRGAGTSPLPLTRQNLYSASAAA